MKLRRLLFVSLLLLVAVPLAVRAQTPDEKTLVVAQSVDISGMEPNMISSRAEANIANEIFGTLYEVNSKGAIVPYLANDFKESADGKELTFTLNEGLTCHDGEALTAEDVAYTFNRAADPANKFNGNTPGFVFDALKFKSAKADDDLHVTLTIGNYSPIALGLLAEVYIHCKDSYEKMSLEEAAKNPIGSGPYKWVEWKKDEYVLLEKFAGFTLRPANFDKVYWRVIPEASTRVAELIAGNVDIIGNVPPDQIPAIDGSGTASSIAVSGTRRMYVGFNFSDKFKDAPGWDAIMKKDVRVALQYAVDVPTICKTLLGTDCDRAASMVNPPNDNPDIKPYPYDPVKAGELLDAAGYPKTAVISPRPPAIEGWHTLRDYAARSAWSLSERCQCCTGYRTVPDRCWCKDHCRTHRLE